MFKQLIFFCIFVVLKCNGQLPGLDISSLSSLVGNPDDFKIDEKDLQVGRGLGPIPDLSKCRRKRNGEFDFKRMMKDFTITFHPRLQMYEERISGRKPVAHLRNKLFGQFIDCEKFIRDIFPQTAFGAADDVKAGDLLGVFTGNTAALGGLTDLLNPDALIDKAFDPCVNLMQVKERKCKNLQQGVCEFSFKRDGANMASICKLVHLGNIAALAEVNCTSKSGMSKIVQNQPLPRVLFNTQLPGGTFQGFAKLCGGHARPAVPIPKNPTSKLMGKLNTLQGANPLSGIIPGIRKKR